MAGGAESSRHFFNPFLRNDVFSIPVRLHIKLGYTASNYSRTV